MRRPWIQWTLAIVVTLTSAVWQRMTGPTYPVRGGVQLAGEEIRMRLTRTHSITGRQPVTIAAANPAITGVVEWRRYPTSDPWQAQPMRRVEGRLEAALPPEPEPLMPAAGKLEYRVRLSNGTDQAAFPGQPAVTRFKGDVPSGILGPHIFAMFFGMLLSTRAGLAALFGGQTRRTTWLTVALLVVGGLVLGPIVQRLAFGAYWTGVPWGWDLTDNKTLIAAVAWAFAAWRVAGGRRGRVAVTVAALVTLVVFAIPHSVWGSEARWTG